MGSGVSVLCVMCSVVVLYVCTGCDVLSGVSAGCDVLSGCMHRV
jgi:hypothetical protein